MQFLTPVMAAMPFTTSMVLVLTSALPHLIERRLKESTTAKFSQDNQMTTLPFNGCHPSWHCPSTTQSGAPIRSSHSTALEFSKQLTIGVTASATASLFGIDINRGL